MTRGETDKNEVRDGCECDLDKNYLGSENEVLCARPSEMTTTEVNSVIKEEGNRD